jgi:signal transduction histidine kinase
VTRSLSITRRLVATVLVLELFSAVLLIGAITVHERNVQLKSFDASLMAAAESLMGAVQEAEDPGDNVMLDMRGVQLGRDAVYRVEDERGRVLGAKGDIPLLEPGFSSQPHFQNQSIGRREYRFISLHGIRMIDPGEPGGGVTHNITVVYGAAVRHVWHEVFEAIRFFTIATAILLGLTAAMMAWLVRRGLSPVYDLANAAERISSSNWHFEAPLSAKETVELQPLAAALEAALGRLQRLFEQQRRFTSDAAHELKTDVAIVKSSLQLLAMRRRTAEEYSHGLAVSLEDFTRLEATVQKMLTLARLEQSSGAEDMARAQSCSLGDVVQEAVHLSRALADLKTVQLNTILHRDARAPIAREDALLLCSNILVNALEHSPAGSLVEIELDGSGNTARLAICDQGEGIAEEDRPHVFDPFYRGDPSRSRKSGGTGLGLAICKAICDRAGGSIHIASGTAGGTVITVSLPAELDVVAPEHSASIKAQ